MNGSKKTISVNGFLFSAGTAAILFQKHPRIAWPLAGIVFAGSCYQFWRK